MSGPLSPLAAQIVGSYSKPPWLVGENDRLRVRRFEPDSYWQPADPVLREAQEDAARLAIYEQELAGMAIVTDGEPFRHTYDTSFLLRMRGIDFEQWAPRPLQEVDIPTWSRIDYSPEEEAEARKAPRVLEDPTFADHTTAQEVTFAKTVASRPLKAAVAGPFTLSRRVVNATGQSDEALIFAFARAVNTELRALQEAGADLLQLDEPSAHIELSKAEPVLTEAIDIALDGLTVPTIVHVCYGYPIYHLEVDASPTYARCIELVTRSTATGISIAYTKPAHEPSLLEACGSKHVAAGMLDIASPELDDVDVVARRIEGALSVVPADRLHPSVDCGMWFVPRPLAFQKLKVLGAAVRAVAGQSTEVEA